MNSDFKELLHVFNAQEVDFGKADLITAKKAVGRDLDLHDIEEIHRADS